MLPVKIANSCWIILFEIHAQHYEYFTQIQFNWFCNCECRPHWNSRFFVSRFLSFWGLIFSIAQMSWTSFRLSDHITNWTCSQFFWEIIHVDSETLDYFLWVFPIMRNLLLHHIPQCKSTNWDHKTKRFEQLLPYKSQYICWLCKWLIIVLVSFTVITTTTSAICLMVLHFLPIWIPSISFISISYSLIINSTE